MKKHLLLIIVWIICFQGNSTQASNAQNIARIIDAENCNSLGIDLPNLRANSCTSADMTAPLVGDDSGYYGVLAIDVTGDGSITGQRNFGKALQNLLGVKKKFSGSISISVSDQGIVIYERPLLLVTVEENGGSSIQFNSTVVQRSDITPIFPLKGHRPLTVQLKISQVRNQDSNTVQALSRGISLLNEMGGQSGWLLTAASNQTYLAAAAKAEVAINRLYSNQVNISSSAELGHADGAIKRIQYKILLLNNNETKIRTTVDVYLRTMPSLITNQMLPAPFEHIPNVNGLTSDWASQIYLTRNPDQTLASYLKEKGVPAKLTGLDVSREMSGPVPRIDVVNDACKALRAALEDAPLRLSDADRDLILFSELRKRGVLGVFSANELNCLDGVREYWISRYGLIVPRPPTEVIERDIQEREKTERLKRLASHWAIEQKEDREELLASEDFTNPVRLMAMPDLLPGMSAPTAPNPETGLASWEIDPKHLALLKKSCFGNQKSNSPTDRWQTAFAQFEGSSITYLLTLHFKADESWGKSGPRIRALTIKRATDQDKRDFNNNGNCLGDT